MSELCKIELEVMDKSAMQIAYAVCKYYLNNNSKKENALIDLEEVAEHINAYIKAERKAAEARE